jgi:hypothetical protein
MWWLPTQTSRKAHLDKVSDIVIVGLLLTEVAVEVIVYCKWQY